MTDHLEISRKLALAIGYSNEDMLQQKSPFTDNYFQLVRRSGGWYAFDCRSWETIGPIAERYKAFPQWLEITKTWWVDDTCEAFVDVEADTPQLAIAKAVIAAQGVK